MDLQELQNKVAERVRSIDCLASLPIFEEEKGNIIENVESEIPRSNFCIVIGSVGFTDESPDSSLCYGRTTITISIFEDPLLNRETSGRPTYLQAAQAIAKSLKLFDTGDGTLTSPVISEPQDLGGGVISATVRFEIKTTL